MKPPYWLRLALREIQNHRGFSLAFILTVALGLGGFVALSSFSLSLTKFLDSRSKELVGADIKVSNGQPLSEQQVSDLVKTLPKGAELARQVSFYSMVSVNQKPRLVRIRGISANFPFFGSLRLKSNGEQVGLERTDFHSRQLAWVEPELMAQFDAEVGTPIQIGQATFTIQDAIVDDSTSAAFGFRLAPTVIISEESLEATELMVRGSRIRYHYLVRVPNDLEIDETVKELKSVLTIPNIQISGHRGAAQEFGRMLNYLTDYLSLAAVVAIFLAGVGIAYLYRHYVMSKISQVAILMSLGAPPTTARRVYLAQLLILGFLGSFAAIFTGWSIIHLLPAALGSLLPESVRPELQLGTIATTILIGISSTFLFCFPTLKRLSESRPSLLFQESRTASLSISGSVIWQYIPLLIFFWGLSVFESHSLFVGSLFVGLFLLALLLLTGLWLGVFAVFRAVRARSSYPVQLPFAYIVREPLSSTTAFLALASAMLLVVLVPQIKDSVASELTYPQGVERPDLFLMDIQDEQVEDLAQYLSENDLKAEYLSPLVRARLVGLKGEVIERPEEDSSVKSREDERNEWYRRKLYNLSSRDKLAPSEQLITGTQFSGPYDWEKGGDVELSIERRFAQRLDLEVGDSLTFDIQGVEVKGRVVNTRKVKWASFQPNFYVVLQPGVLDDAPKTFLTSVPKVSFEDKVRLQSEIVTAFPNVSIIDVSKTIEKILTVAEQMVTALVFMAYLSLVAGLIVLFSICVYQANKRRWDVSLLKSIGMPFWKIRLVIFVEFFAVSAIATIAGTIIGVGLAVGLTMFIFDVPLSSVVVNYYDALMILAGTLGFAILIITVSIWNVLRTPPAALLNAGP